jgi:conjugal transfer mating pair stabilization protein TraG
MFPDQIIYTANGDLTIFNAILNAIAMVCGENDLIWGFALISGLWALVSMSAAAGVNAASGTAGAELGKRAVGLLIPFILAITLTNGQMKTTVTVENLMTSATVSVDNIPIVISFLPATASRVSQLVGQKLETAMQLTGTDYSSISATHNGFINPLKILLTSRTAVLKLGGIASEINALTTACLGSDSGVDYGDIAKHVMFAGNLPTAQAGPASISVWSGTGNIPTSIGQLLAEAAQNTTAIVTEIKVGTQNFATCSDAANQVAADIEDALMSDDFKRVVQGAVNTADQPNSGQDSSINGVVNAYTAVRTATTVTNTLAGGVQQANAETINLLFSELVKNDLDCLHADGSNKSTCLAMAVQANEIERNNIQAAANGFESLMYAGAFANQLTAVVIALGPVIIMFMMWSGVNAARNMKVAAHMIVWPLLIMNVGAELINGMIYISVSNFLQSVAQGGVINQAVAVEAYKNFSLQIGTASHLMATLPILMSTIFALGESAALVRISDSIGSNSKDVSQDVNPAPVNTVPLMTNSSVASAEQGVGGPTVSLNGAIPAAAGSVQLGSAFKEASSAFSSAEQRTRVISSGENLVSNFQHAVQSGEWDKVGLSSSAGASIKELANKNFAAEQHARDSQSTNSSKANSNDSSGSYSVGANLGVGAEGGIGQGGGKGGMVGLLSGGVHGGGELKSGTSASDSLQKVRSIDQADSVSAARSLVKAFDQFKQTDDFKNMGHDKQENMQRSFGAMKQYTDTVSDSKSNSDVASETVKASSGLVAYAGKVEGKNFAHMMAVSRDFQRFYAKEGGSFANSAAAKPYMELAREQAKLGVTDHIEDSRANEALMVHRAAALLASDPNASTGERYKAAKFITDATNVMFGAHLESQLVKAPEHFNISKPTNRTGINESALVRKVTAATPHVSGKGKAIKQEQAELVLAGSHLKSEVAGDVVEKSGKIIDGRKTAQQTTDSAGLSGNEAKDTRTRNRGAIADNFKSTLPKFMQGDDKPDLVGLPDKDK